MVQFVLIMESFTVAQEMNCRQSPGLADLPPAEHRCGLCPTQMNGLRMGLWLQRDDG